MSKNKMENKLYNKCRQYKKNNYVFKILFIRIRENHFIIYRKKKNLFTFQCCTYSE